MLTREDNHAKSASARVLRGRLACSPQSEAREGRVPWRSKTVATTSRSRSRRFGEMSAKKASANGVGWSTSRVGRENNCAKSASARLLCGQLAVLFMGRSARGSHATEVKRGTTTLRSRSRRPGTVSAKKSLDQRRGMERVALWPRRQPHQLFQRGRAPSAVGPFCTGRSARGLRGIGFNTTAMTFRSCARRPGAVSVKKILGQ